VSLLKHDPFEDATPAVTVHRLVQRVARARSEANGSAQDGVGRLTARLVAIYPEEGYSDPQSWPVCARLTPHVIARYEAGAGDASKIADWADLLMRAGEYFYGRAAYSQAAPLFRDALAIREKALGSEHPHTAASLNNLALLLKAQGDFAGARPLYERALAIREKALGPEHPNTAQSLNNLALLLKAEGDFAGARPLYERALAIDEKALGPEHPGTARRLSLLTTKFSDGITPGPRKAPASPPMRSTRLAAQRRRRRCGSGMGSRVLTTQSAHERLSGWPRTLLAKVKQQRRALAAFLKWGWAALSRNRAGKGGSFDARPAPSSGVQALVVIPMATKDCFGFMSQMRPTRLRPEHCSGFGEP
jgi:tetratricopeptide (TPR) repeat protein